MTSKTLRSIATVGLLLAATSAQAHPGHGIDSFSMGLAHPFAGLDHLLAMVAVGLWSHAALEPGRRLAGPALFVALLLCGALAGMAGLALPGTELAIAASVSLLGAVLLLAGRVAPSAGLMLVGAAALLHGMPHGAEMAPGGVVVAYASGFMFGSALLHGVGLAAGRALARMPAWAARVAASLIGTAGLVMLAARV